MSFYIFIEEEMGGVRPEDVFESLSAFEKPVAAASLGQVYKAKLKSTGVTGDHSQILRSLSFCLLF